MYSFHNGNGLYLCKYTKNKQKFKYPIDKYSKKYYNADTKIKSTQTSTNNGGVFVWENIIYLHPQRRRPVRIGPYKAGEDLQNQAPLYWCSCCGKEVYSDGKYVCEECERWGLYGKSDEA